MSIKTRLEKLEQSKTGGLHNKTLEEIDARLVYLMGIYEALDCPQCKDCTTQLECLAMDEKINGLLAMSKF